MNTIHRPTCTTKGSASQAWMLWGFPLSKGNEVDQMIGFLSGLISNLQDRGADCNRLDIY